MTADAANVYDTLLQRGLIAQCSDAAALRAALEPGGPPITVYCGYDATAPSLHVGHLVPITILVHLQRAGHRVIAVVGGGTTRIGDPTGKSAVRPMMGDAEIDANVERIQRQLAHHLDFTEGRALMVNNAEWLLKLGYIDFLREIGRHFTVNQLMQHETYWERFQNSSLSFIEMNYAMIQAYDFLHLFRAHGCRLQVGGNDQWYNILAGVDLTRRAADGQAFALTGPLLTTASGAKMGKTEAGAVWLDPEQMAPYDFYQYWRNTEDLDVGRFLRIFTFLAEDEIARLKRLKGAEINRAKEVLAFEVTRRVHGDSEAARAQETARARFGGSTGAADQGPTVTVSHVADLSALIVLAGLADSRGAEKRLIKGGGVRLGANKEPTDRPVRPSELPSLLGVGKRRVLLEP
ncbi:MAG: tyrosine--tRNA ligase [Chloroflexi bacterium]|nr:tyrosine--tRNA ligase [Chloroflexota bacterium]